jgi:nucleoside-diphosphate-sugar epimerase
MKVIVTGGSGFLGTNLINKLTQKKNYSVFSIDKKN